MKRILIYTIIMIGVLLAPLERTDVGKLRPVQSVAIYKERDNVVVRTDTGDVGEGPDARAALENLQETTPAVIYLDTAVHLLLAEGCTDVLEHVRGCFKKTVELYYFLGDPDLETVSEYLSIHGRGVALKHWAEGVELPVLDCRKERIKIL